MKINTQLIFIAFIAILITQSLKAQNIFPENGNVGIGISNPQKKLEIWTPVNDYMSVGSFLMPGQFAGIHFGYLEKNNFYRKSALVFERLDNAARGKVHILNSGGFNEGSANLSDARLTINYDGKVGINTTNPIADLDVNGEIKWSGFNAGNNRALKIGYSGGNYGGIGYNIDFKAESGFFDRPLNDRSSYLEFTNGGFRFFGTDNPVLSSNISLEGQGTNLNFLAVLTSTGNMGIGTTTPQEKLSVNGKIRAKEVKVEATNWPDYVFKTDYFLPSLAETEKHIKEKGYLPGMPSAQEVAQNGLELGEMNKLLLKKIEELTLHLIEQNKQIKKLMLQMQSKFPLRP